MDRPECYTEIVAEMIWKRKFEKLPKGYYRVQFRFDKFNRPIDLSINGYGSFWEHRNEQIFAYCNGEWVHFFCASDDCIYFCNSTYAAYMPVIYQKMED